MADRLGPPLPAPLYDRVAVIGLGLIGASLCRVARAQRIAQTVVGADADPAVRRRAEEIDLADLVAPTVEAAVAGDDLVILCTPVGAMATVAERIAPHLRAGATISDRHVGSTGSHRDPFTHLDLDRKAPR